MRRRRFQAGFTLFEMLLVAGILVLLAGAAVTSLNAMRRGAELNEGVRRVEAILRFAGAEAASRGRRVRLIVDPQAADLAGGVPEPGPAETNASPFRVEWEPDPLNRPGEFVPLNHPLWADMDWARQLRIVALQSGEAGACAGADLGGALGLSGVAPGAPTQTAIQPATILFYPDGSSLSLTMAVGSVDPEDPRLFEIRLNGMSGVVRHREISEEEWTLIEEGGQAADSTGEALPESGASSYAPAGGAAPGSESYGGGR